jgi:hypothetical protein
MVRQPPVEQPARGLRFVFAAADILQDQMKFGSDQRLALSASNALFDMGGMSGLGVRSTLR